MNDNLKSAIDGMLRKSRQEFLRRLKPKELAALELSDEERIEFSCPKFDEQIEDDAVAGRLMELSAEAEEDYNNERTEEL